MTSSKKTLVSAFLIIVGGSFAFYQARKSVDTRQPVTINNLTVQPVPTLNAEHVSLGKTLYASHCAACHGDDLAGAADWKKPLADGSFPPPPQDSSGHTWHHPDPLILEMIAQGGDPTFNSKMPAFEGRLSDNDIQAILEFIKSSWGPEEREFQWWITASAGSDD